MRSININKTMLILSIIKFLFALNCWSNVVAQQFPKDLKVCRLGDNDCVTKSASAFLHNNRKGNQEIGLPQLDPFKIPTLLLARGSDSPITIDLKLQNVDIKGLSDIKFDKILGFTKDTSQFEFYGTAPQISVRGRYQANGRVFVLPIQGNGNFSIILDDLKMGIKIKPFVESIFGGKHFYGIEKIKTRVQPTKMKIRLTNLFNGNRELGKNMNKFLNDNWRDVWSEMSRPINNAVAGVVEDIFQNIFDRYAFEDFFIE